MLSSLLMLLLLCSAPAGPDELHRAGFADKDLVKVGKDVAAYFEAVEQDERREQNDLLEAIQVAMAKLHKRSKDAAPLLTCLGDWDRLFELSKPEVKAFKSKAGRGFFRAVFEDSWSGHRVVSMLSLPKGRGRATELAPAIVALKPRLDLTGSELEERVAEMAQAAYGSLTESHIILVPLGPESGEGRRAQTAEVDGSWLTDESLVTLFTGLRLLTEQVRHDRSRLVLDGWGEAALDALRLATLSPAWFAGVIDRSGDVGGEDLLLGNLTGVRVLYVQGAADGNDADPADLVRRAGKRIDVSVLEESGSAFSPSAETLTSIAAWLDGCRRDLAPAELSCDIGDVRFGGGLGWLQVTRLDRRPSARPGDKDFPRLKAVADRASNTVTVDAVNVLEMWVYLSDAILDLDRDVKILVNGEEKVSRRFERDLRTMLDNRYFNNSGEFGLYTAKVRIEEIDPNVAR